MFYIAVGHAGDVVGYCAGEALGGDFGLVVGGELGGVGDQGVEEALDYPLGVGVGFLHAGGVVEAVKEKLLGLGAFVFDFGA